jgi:hypothetical protein
MASTRPRIRFRLRIALLLSVVAMLLLAAPVRATPLDRSSNVLYDFMTGEPINGSNSKLIRTDFGLAMTLRTLELEPGHAYTIWWVVFNRPEACSGGPTEGPLVGMFECGETDLGNPDVELTLAVASGNVAGASGRGNFGSFLRVGDARDVIGQGAPLFSGPLTNPRGAEVHLVVRDHGPLNLAWMPDQIRTFGGGCDQDDPSYPPFLVGEGVAGDFVCVEPQFTFHVAD